ncbi:MAG: hypothetical protein NT011_07885 [Kiritimatiellaeota bacterium]|nr:hypothetical protein [Kiritimatiellota bacterium]
MKPGNQILSNPQWEQFAEAMAAGKSRAKSYMQAYGIKNRKAAMDCAWRLLKHTEINDRITFLSKKRQQKRVTTDPGKGINLQSVINTCQEVIETSESNPQKLKAIEVLNKLGVFDNEIKNDGNRMDPASICAYLDQFAAAPAEHLAQIPGGLPWMMKKCMELTSTTWEQVKAALDEIDHDNKTPEPLATTPDTVEGVSVPPGAL